MASCCSPSVSTCTSVRGTTVVSPFDSGLGLADLRLLGDGHREVALRDRDGGDAHVLAHDDDAGALVDDDAGELVGLDAQLLDLGEQAGPCCPGSAAGNLDRDGRGIGRLGDLAAQKSLIAAAMRRGGGQVRVAQGQPQGLELPELEVDLAFDQRAVGDAPDRRHAAGDRGGVASAEKPEIATEPCATA